MSVLQVSKLPFTGLCNEKEKWIEEKSKRLQSMHRHVMGPFLRISATYKVLQSWVEKKTNFAQDVVAIKKHQALSFSMHGFCNELR
eukprot:5448039-Amphidinium_carterae.1